MQSTQKTSEKSLHKPQSAGTRSEANIKPGLPKLDQKKQLLNSRMFDNHFDPKVHHNPWIAPGLQPDLKCEYLYNDSGLSWKLNNKYDNILSQQRQQLSEMGQGLRNYKEFDEIKDREIIVTIEYCTNCKQHEGTTRHDEQKYLNFALNVKKEILKHFPITKVFLKPNIVDESDHSIENNYARRRIGAFEVQIATMRKGMRKRDILFSKLKSGNWPSIGPILLKMRDYMQQSTLNVQIELQDFNFQEIPSEKLRNKQINKLYNIPVIFKPYRQQRQNSAYGQRNNQQVGQQQTDPDFGKSQSNANLFNNTISNTRPPSGNTVQRNNSAIRPKSAYSNVSNHTVVSLNNKMTTQQTQGQDDNQQNKATIIELTNPQGQIEFKDVPFDIYILEIKETNDYKGFCKKVDFFDKQKKGEPMQEIIQLQHRDLSFVKISCTYQYEPKNEFGYLDDAIIKLIPFKKENPSELNEIDTVTDKFNKMYDSTVVPGKYQLVIEKNNFEKLEQIIELKPGTQEFTLGPINKLSSDEEEEKKVAQQDRSRYQSKQNTSSLGQSNYNSNQKSKSPENINKGNTNHANAYKGDQGKAQSPDKNQPQDKPQSAKNKDRPISAGKLLTIFVYDASTNKPIPEVKVKIMEKKLPRKDDEGLITDEQGVCKLLLQNVWEGQLEISHNEFFQIVEEYGPTKMDITKMKDLSFPLMRRPEQQDEVHIRVLTNIAKKVLTLHIVGANDNAVSTTVDDIEIQNPQEDGKGHMILKNLNQKKGIFRLYATIISPQHFNPSSIKFYIVNHNEMYLIEVPKAWPTQEPPKYWDIGLIRSPSCDFVEINSPTQQEIKRDWLLLEYQNLLGFLQNSKSIDRKTILGFNSNQKMELNGDTFVGSKIIIDSLDKYNFEQSGKIIHFLHSAINMNGLYSFNKLNNKFSSIKQPYNFVDIKDKKPDEEEEDEYLGEEYQ